MQIDGSIEFKPGDPHLQQHSEALTGKARTEFKPSALEHQLSPSRHGGADGRHTHKTQQPSMMMRVRGTPPVDSEEL